MLKLDSPDLPTTAIARKSAGFVRLYRNITTKALAPIAGCDFYHQYGVFTPQGFDVDSTPLSDPDYAGNLLSLDLGFTISTITNTGVFTQVTDPFTVLPGKFWLNGSIIHIYGNDAFPLTPGDDFTVSAIATSTLQNPDSGQVYAIAGDWTGCTISTVVIEGLTFTSAVNPSSPQPGEFKNSAGVLTLYGNDLYAPRIGAEVLIAFEKTYEVPEVEIVIATYDLAYTGVTLVDTVDHLGRAFHPPTDAFDPQVGDFFWSTPYLTLFLERTMAIALNPKQSLSATTSTVGSISYDSYVEYS